MNLDSCCQHLDLPEQFRLCLRGFASTVTVLSTENANARFAMLVTAITAIALHPPTLAVAVNRSSRTHAPLLERGTFCINVLTEKHARIGRSFANHRCEERFAYGSWREHNDTSSIYHGIPFISDAQALFFCQIEQAIPVGTHTIFVSTVEIIYNNDATDPLLYCDGQFGSFLSANAFSKFDQNALKASV
jgi:flavin reductase (DIM6/NTAB) family NADH-FMN oxidoreductase RutF